MNYGFSDFLTLIGALGMFLYGMNLMSEALQKVAGDRLRSILSAMTSNRLGGILTGVLVTAIIQSSSATTVMVVSFVNAGLLSLVQSIGVIMGANIGTTVTAWIISIAGFKCDIGAIALPLMGLALPLIFQKRFILKYWGEFIVGFALLFKGLEYLKTSVPDLKSNPEMLSFLQDYTSFGYGSILLFLLVGTILTIVVQSSSATMAITLIMCSNGWISLEIAAAMVLGENIGTTVTANIAALSGNTSARRAALSHFFFNVFGVIWVLVLFYPFIGLVKYIVFGDASYDTTTIGGDANCTFALSLFHTMFNVCNVLILSWFVKSIARFVTYILPQKEDSEEVFHLKHISTGMLSTSELSLLQANKEILVYATRTRKMFGMVKDLYEETDQSKFAKLYTRIEKYEAISDRVEVEIANYLTKVSEGRLSADSKQKLLSMLKMVSEIESIGDSCYNLARTISRKHDDEITFGEEVNTNVKAMFSLADDALVQMIAVEEQFESGSVDVVKSYNIENEINNLRNQLKAKNAQDVKTHLYTYKAGVHYMDLVTECEKLGDYVLNVVEAMAESKMKVAEK